MINKNLLVREGALMVAMDEQKVWITLNAKQPQIEPRKVCEIVSKVNTHLRKLIWIFANHQITLYDKVVGVYM